MNNNFSLSLEITADPAKLKAGLAVSRRDILATYAELKNGVGEAGKKLAEAQTNAQALGRELGRVGPPTKAMVREFDKARAAVVSAKDAVEKKTLALQRQRGLVQANAQAFVAATRAEQQVAVNAAATVAAAQRAAHQGRMGSLAREIAAAKAAADAQVAAAAVAAAAQSAAHQRRMGDLVQEIAAAKAAAAAQQSRALMLTPLRGAGQAREMSVLAVEARNASVAVGGVARSTAAVAATAPGLVAVNGQMRAISAGVAALGTAALASIGVAELLRLSDAYTAVNSRLKVYAQSNADLANSQQRVFGIAQDYGRDLTGTATLLGRLVQPLRDMGRAGGDAVKITDAVAASLRIAGATTSESTASQIQFGQAIAANTLQGEELNSVLENSPPLARALAVAMRRSVGDLKKMGAEGKLTGQIIAEALLSQADDLRRRALAMESTMGESLTRIQNSFMKTFGERTGGGAVALATGLSAVANNMEAVVDVAALAGAALTAAFGVRLLSSIWSAVVAKQAVIAAERQAAAAALTTAQANVRAAQAEAARTLTTGRLASAQAGLVVAERAAALAAGGAVARAGAGALALLGGPVGAISAALALGVTAWQLWGNRAETATDVAAQSLADLVKEMKDFGENATADQRVKQYEALAVAISKARDEEIRLRQEARQRANSDMNVATKAQAEAAVDADPAVVAKVDERRQAEQFLQDELTKLTKKATDERAFLVRSLVEKQRALNGELVVNEKTALETRVKDNKAAADAVRDAWLKSLDEIKAKRAEAEAAPGRAADRAASLGGRIDQVRMSGMSEQQRAAEQARQARAAQEGAVANRTRGSFELTKGYSQQLAGDLDKAKASFNAAEKDLERAFTMAEKAGDAGLMDEIAARLVDIEKQRGAIAAAEAKELETQAEGQRQKMLELDGAAEALKAKLAGMEVDVKIDAAMANIQALQAEAAKLQAMLAGSAGAAGAKPAAAPAAIPARAFGGELPGFAPHDRADNGLYRGTPGEWVIQRPSVRYYGRGFIRAINEMRLPKFAYGGEIGGLASRLQVPSISRSAIRSGGDGQAAVLDLGALGRIRMRSTSSTEGDVEKVLKIAALRYGRF